jgi:hypothetical protein
VKSHRLPVEPEAGRRHGVGVLRTTGLEESTVAFEPTPDNVKSEPSGLKRGKGVIPSHAQIERILAVAGRGPVADRNTALVLVMLGNGLGIEASVARTLGRCTRDLLRRLRPLMRRRSVEEAPATAIWSGLRCSPNR